MASKQTGFHPQDADWTRGREQAIADAESIARRQMGMTRTVTLKRAADDYDKRSRGYMPNQKRAAE